MLRDLLMRSYTTQELLTEDSATDVRLQQFSKQIKRSNRRTKFNAEIVSEYPSNHFFMVWLSKKSIKMGEIFIAYVFATDITVSVPITVSRHVN